MVNPELTGTFAFYGSILLAKMGLMGPLTARQRFRKMVFANPEDTTSGGTVAYADSDVERVRRAHQNDLENIPLFFLATHFYLSTNPSTAVATNLIRGFTALRFIHTFVYLNQVPQPSRALSFILGLGITLYMCGATALHYM